MREAIKQVADWSGAVAGAGMGGNIGASAGSLFGSIGTIVGGLQESPPHILRGIKHFQRPHASLISEHKKTEFFSMRYRIMSCSHRNIFHKSLFIKMNHEVLTLI